MEHRPLGNAAAQYVRDPWVQYCAWKKLQTVMRDRWRREPEAWKTWDFHPEEQCKRVAEAVISGDFSALNLEMPLVPFPKGEGKVRHFVRPTLDGEYATLLLGVLLCPLVEARMWSFSFGGRWYRGITRGSAVKDRKEDREDPDQSPWDFREAEPALTFGRGHRWTYHTLPFSLSDKQVFPSYRHSYGLMRRVASWTVRSMLGEDPGVHTAPGEMQTVDDYCEGVLPYVGKPFRKQRLESNDQLWHARLDLEMAYPSVDRTELRKRLVTLLEGDVSSALNHFEKVWNAAPPLPFSKNSVWGQLEGLSTKAIRGSAPTMRHELANRWMDLLDAIQYNDVSGIRTKCWPSKPTATSSQRFKYDRWGSGTSSRGLPTGVSVSSVWFNVYLNGLDQTIAENLGLVGQGEKRLNAAVLRYMDDIVVVGESRSRVCELIGVVHRWCEGGNDDLRLSVDKTKPALLREPLKKTEGTVEGRTTEAWKDHPCVHHIDRFSLGPFISSLVESMSALGAPGLAETWGNEVGARLNELHRLCRDDIGDAEVRPDTRLAFAGGRIAVAPLPSGPERVDASDAQHLRRILRSFIQALGGAPWKLSLWRGAVRLLVRLLAAKEQAKRQRTEKGRAQHLEKIEQLLEDWQEQIFNRLLVGGTLDKGEGWEACEDPTVSTESKRHHSRRTARGMRVAPLVTSFLRAGMLHAFGDTIQDLYRQTAPDTPYLKPQWNPAHWTSPIISYSVLSAVQEELVCWARATLEAYRQPRIPLEREARERLREVLRPLTLRLRPCKDAERHHLLTTARREPETLARVLEGWESRGDIDKPTLVALAVRHGLAQWVSQERAEEWRATAENPDPASPWQLHRSRALRRFVLASSPSGDLDIPVDEDPWLAPASVLDILWQQDPAIGGLGRANIPRVGLPPLVVFDLIDAVYGKNPPKEDIILSRITDQPLLATGLSMLATGIEVEAETARALRVLRRRQLRQGVPHWEGSSAWTKPPAKHVDWNPKLNEGLQHPFLVALQSRKEWPSTAEWSPKDTAGALLQGATLAAGSEAVLDALLEAFPRLPSATLRRDLRERFDLPIDYWNQLHEALSAEKQHKWRRPVGCDDHIGLVVVDDGKDDEHDDEQGTQAGSGNGIRKHLLVRMAQLRESPWDPRSSNQGDDHRSVVTQWPRPRNGLGVLREVARHLPHRSQGDPSSPIPDLTLFPEVFIPNGAARYLAASCRMHGIGMLSGCYWRVLPNVADVGWATHRWFANEALLVEPWDNDDPGCVPRLRRVRKPEPAVSELGLERALCRRSGLPDGTPILWHFARGDRAYLFKHRTRGNFSVGICSDLLDPVPWTAMKGRLQHLFFVAHNEDVDTFAAISRTRSYENYCNVVVLNHGYKGGSFAWTPRSRKGKEIARFQGEGLDVVSDIQLPVKPLIEAQRTQLERSTETSAQGWVDGAGPRRTGWKAPPPTFRTDTEGDTP